jgi:hypothetical protein
MARIQHFLVSSQESKTMPSQTASCSLKLNDGLGTPHTASFCAADLSSFSSADLSSMIASWVDRNSCGEYEKELKVSSGMNFKTIAMRHHTPDKITIEEPRRSVGCTTYQSSQDIIDDLPSSDPDWLKSPKRRCTNYTMEGQNFLRYHNCSTPRLAVLNS